MFEDVRGNSVYGGFLGRIIRMNSFWISPSVVMVVRMFPSMTDLLCKMFEDIDILTAKTSFSKWGIWHDVDVAASFDYCALPRCQAFHLARVVTFL